MRLQRLTPIAKIVGVNTPIRIIVVDELEHLV
jgi:hypothetical protein